MKKQKYNVYIMISQTPTKFGGYIRRFGKIKYNHASIAFDHQLNELYSFGRMQNNNPMGAGLVREYVERFTLRKKMYVAVRIYRISVTKEQYLAGKKRISEIALDPDGYMYNLLSVLSFPLFHGFKTYKAYTCSEFVAHILREMDALVCEHKPCHQYIPEEMGEACGGVLVFEGNLLDYLTYRMYKPKNANNYFAKAKYRQVAKTSFMVPYKLLYRKIKYRNKM
jgi:hypothetical protein